MKKILSFLLIVTFIFVMSGCSLHKCSICGEGGNKSYNEVKKYKYYGRERYLCRLCYLEYLTDKM